MSGEDEPSEAEQAGFAADAWEGIFVMRGQALSISEFTISIDDEGKVETTGPKLSFSVHMAPYWLTAAVDHVIDAERMSHDTNAAFKGDDPEAKRLALEAELIASMQAITCAAFALDALHAALLHVQPTPEATRNAWRRNGTKRSRQMFETLRRAFKLGPKTQKGIISFLDQLATYRDSAVHPPSKSQLATRHPRLPVSLDPAFSRYRALNAILIVGQTVRLLHGAGQAETTRSEAIRERMKPLAELLEPVVERWNFSTPNTIYTAALQRAEKGEA